MTGTFSNKDREIVEDRGSSLNRNIACSRKSDGFSKFFFFLLKGYSDNLLLRLYKIGEKSRETHQRRV